MLYHDANPVQRLLRSVGGWAPVSLLLSLVADRVDRAVFRMTGGRHTLVSLMSGLPVVILDTTGAKTGLRRRLPVVAIPDGADLVVIASNFGKGRHPAWYFNLLANPTASVIVGGEIRRVRAREATGEARERLWRRALEVFPSWRAYARRARDRTMPIMVLSAV